MFYEFIRWMLPLLAWRQDVQIDVPAYIVVKRTEKSHQF